MSRPIAVVLGVGAENGLGGAVCHRAAQAGHHVVIAGRTRDKVEALEAGIIAKGGTATSHVVDVTQEDQIKTLFDTVDTMDGQLDFVTYNAGNAFRHDTLTMPAAFFEEAWRVCCLGGFLTGQAAGARLAALGSGTILFTGATASIKARPPFLAFASGKAALRAVAAGLARELGPRGIHVAHAIIDGGIDGALLNNRNPARKAEVGENGMLLPSAIAETYWQLHLQHPSAWAFEVDLRPFKETF